MHDFWAVVRELLHFCLGSVLPTRAVARESDQPTVRTDAQQQTTQKVDDTTPDRPPLLNDLSLPAGEIAYVHVSLARCFVRAVHSFDGVVQRLPYGTAVVVGRRTGRFVEVAGSFGTGWVLFDELTTNRAAIWPECVVGEYYDAVHVTTQAIRTLLADEFAAADLLLPLTAEEYVTYRLLQQGQSITWPKTRPRLAGSWHTLLRGMSQIHIGVVPKTGAVLEWIDSTGEGRVAYVEAVSPDEQVTLTTVGLEAEGVCSKRKVLSAEWHEWRPVWITVL